ncbi:fructose-bisphosphate aldolase [Gordonia otitidis]|uniref:glycoside hydrolase family 76 protein n=1 Tax=Gordonia otitidis TaxID=249058 RepID=UPI001D14BA28|nr:glycoside hydrolase family 76 protein [Gordonia otitidis]UEA57891.1 fructose-bisphosphate aldolase [Gordonia otitidis]
MGNASKSPASAVSDPNARAAIAADSILGRHLRHAWWVPGTRLATVAWPLSRLPLDVLRSRFGFWHYWWHAHLLDLIVDAAIHRPLDDAPYDPELADLANRLLRGIRLRNLGRWTNNYYDDMAWLGLAIERADRHLDLHHPKALRVLSKRMYDAWEPERGGGIPWRTIDTFFNAPANGPATILLARTGRAGPQPGSHARRALEMCDWMDATLVDPDSHLVIDGIKPRDGGFERVTAIYTYCQGVVLGSEVEAARLTRDPVHLARIDRLLTAVESHECPDGVIRGAGGGDGGLFMGVLARYLALVATDLPADLPGADELRRRSATLVLTSADAAWQTRTEVDDAVVFSADWHQQAARPTRGGGDAAFVAGAVNSSAVPERDLSVQLSGWMVLEAAAAVDLGLSEQNVQD